MFNFLYKLYFRLFKNVTFGKGVKIYFPVNLYKCYIGPNVRIGPFTEIQNDCSIGRGVVIGSHSFIAAGTHIEQNSFLGHGTKTANDKFPEANNKNWKLFPIHIGFGCSIGSGVNILPGVHIGNRAIVGQGAVVTKSVPDEETWVGNPAKKLEK